MIGLSVGLALLSYAVVVRYDVVYRVHFAYVVALTEREEASEYKFDGYYALQATDLFAATLANWIQSPEVVAAAYERSGVKLPSTQAQRLIQFVRVEKAAPQLIRVSVKGVDRQEALVVAEALREEIVDRVAAYHEEGIPQLRFEAVADREWVSEDEVDARLVALAVFGLVSLFGVNGVLLWAATRSED